MLADIAPEAVAQALDCAAHEVLPFSTGVIMEPLPVERIEAGLPALFHTGHSGMGTGLPGGGGVKHGLYARIAAVAHRGDYQVGATHGVATGRLYLPDVEVFHRDAALDEPALHHVEQRFHPEVAVGHQHDE